MEHQQHVLIRLKEMIEKGEAKEVLLKTLTESEEYLEEICPFEIEPDGIAWTCKGCGTKNETVMSDVMAQYEVEMVDEDEADDLCFEIYADDSCLRTRPTVHCVQCECSFDLIW